MERSEQINELAAALAKAQASLKGAVKDSQNPHLRSKYADLASVWDACREALSKNNLSVTQMPHSVHDEDGRVHLYVGTYLLHSSGQWMGETCEIPLVKQDAQGVGSAITYGRRYGLAAIVGIAPSDDDGEAAVGRTEKPLPDINPNPAPPLTPTQSAALDKVKAMGEVVAPTPAQLALQPVWRPKDAINAFLDHLAEVHEMDIKQVRKIAKQYLKSNKPALDLDTLDKNGVQDVCELLSKCFTDADSPEARNP